MSSLRQTPAAELVQKYGLKVFVETGCDEGDGLRYAQELGLDPRFSCDLNPASVEKCKHLGTVLNLNSIAFLFGMFIEQPALFWLDAHFPEVWGLEGPRWPLPKELIILSTFENIERSVIICDDMHCIQDPNNPLREPGRGHDWYAVEGNIEELKSLLPNHNATLHKIDTGLLIFEPK